jgi:16S rRNA processing protein RimM
VKLEIGRISRAHGLRGEVVVVPVTDQPGRFVPGAEFDSACGPLVVSASRPFQNGFLVCFEGCSSREQAEALRGVVLRAEPVAREDEVFVHQLIGCRVIDQDGHNRGVVTAVEANPAADLLVLDDGALVPMNFVVDVADGRIDVDVPAVLFDR